MNTCKLLYMQVYHNSILDNRACVVVERARFYKLYICIVGLTAICHSGWPMAGVRTATVEEKHKYLQELLYVGLP